MAVGDSGGIACAPVAIDTLSITSRYPAPAPLVTSRIAYGSRHAHATGHVTYVLRMRYGSHHACPTSRRYLDGSRHGLRIGHTGALLGVVLGVHPVLDALDRDVAVKDSAVTSQDSAVTSRMRYRIARSRHGCATG
eukprot:1958178-Rhodomonas_salina.1